MTGPRNTGPSAGSRSSRPALRWALVLIVVAWITLGVVARVWRLDSMGIEGSDTFYYAWLADSWNHGDFTFQVAGRPETRRPVLLAWYATGYRLFGNQDYALKAMNVMADLVTMGLLFAAGCLVTRRRYLLAAVPVMVWSALPTAIYMSRIELPHALSTLMVVASFVCFAAYRRAEHPHRRWSWLAAAGVCVGAAAYTHEELVLFAGGYGFFLFWERPRSGDRDSAMVRICAFALPFFIVASPLLRWYSGTAVELATGSSSAAGASATTWMDDPLRAIRFTGSGLSELSHFVWPLGALAASAWLTLCCVRRRLDWEVRGSVLLPLLLVAVFMALYSVFFWTFFARTLLPGLPLVILAVVFAGAAILRELGLSMERATTWVLCLTLLTTILHFENFYKRSGRIQLPRLDKVDRGVDEFWQRVYGPTWSRSVFDMLGHLVGPDSRLLVASSLMYPYPGRRFLQASVYFGDHASYLIDHEEPLEELIEAQKIEWVLLSGFRADPRVLHREQYRRYLYDGRWSNPQPLHLGAALGLSPEEFTPGTEYRELISRLEALGARLLVASPAEPEGRFPRRWRIYKLPRSRQPASSTVDFESTPVALR